MNWLRRQIADAIWAVGGWIYPYAKYEPDTTVNQGWEISVYLECTEEVADEAFNRMGDAVCGVEHHHLDPCPGPLHVMGMHPVSLESEQFDGADATEAGR